MTDQLPVFSHYPVNRYTHTSALQSAPSSTRDRQQKKTGLSCFPRRQDPIPGRYSSSGHLSYRHSFSVSSRHNRNGKTAAEATRSLPVVQPSGHFLYHPESPRSVLPAYLKGMAFSVSSSLFDGLRQTPDIPGQPGHIDKARMACRINSPDASKVKAAGCTVPDIP